MSNLIQIKRSLTTATPASLANGEFAFTSNGNILYIGANAAVVAIGGVRTPGVLTANQALVANSTGFIDAIKTANLTTRSITANGTSSPGAGYLLSVDAGGNTYWINQGTISINTAAQFSWTNTHSFASAVTFNGGIVANSSLTANGTTGTAGQVLSSNGSSVYWVTPTAADITAVAAGDGLTGGGTAGDVTLNVGAGNGITVTADAIAVDGANGISVTADGVNVLAGAGIVSNTSGVYVNAAALSIATSQLTGDVALGTGTSGNYVATITAGAGISGSSSSEGGAATIAVVANNGITSNTSGVFAKAANGISVDGSGINVTAGNGLVANTTGVHVGSANGINVTADAVGLTTGSTLTVNSTGAHVNTNLAITSLALTQDLTVNGNTTIGSNTSDTIVFNANVASNINPATNATYDFGSIDNRFDTGYFVNVHSGTGYIDGNLQVGGDIIVTGNLVTQNVASITISDPLIYLASNNTVSDLVDIGFAATYSPDGSQQLHTGLFRDASDEGKYKLFVGSQQSLAGNNLINTTAVGYTTAILQTFLESGALQTNATSLTVTANSTVNVNITANSLSLSTALAATDGGTGHDTFTAGDILVASNTSYISKLALGTDGKVLQSNGTALVYDTLDGGTF